MAFWQKVSGVWKATTPYTRVAGVWKSAQLWHKVGAVWKLINNPLPPDGVYSDSKIYPSVAQITLTAQIPVTWTYTGGGVGSSVNVASGGTASSITFTLTGSATPGVLRNASWSVSATDGTNNGAYTVQLEVDNP